MSKFEEMMESAPEWFFWFSGSADWKEGDLPTPNTAHCRVCGEVTDHVAVSTDYECEVCMLSLVE
jgi:hypothetical protein